jgi:hypothetical protein
MGKTYAFGEDRRASWLSGVLERIETFNEEFFPEHNNGHGVYSSCLDFPAKPMYLCPVDETNSE